MKKVLNKIILNFCILSLISSCHTFEHQNIFIETARKNPQKNILNNKKPNYKIIKKITEKEKITEDTMAPISVPNKIEKVKKVALAKKNDVPKIKKFSLNAIKNWSENDLLKKIGEGDFIKQEGKLKNYQYYLSNCFLDIFLLQKENNYYVNHVQTRATKLNGIVNIDECLEEIEKKLSKF